MFRKLSAVDRAGAPVDIYDAGRYSIESVQSTPLRRWGYSSNARIDLTREFREKVPISIKSGIAAKRQAYDRRGLTRTWSFNPNRIIIKEIDHLWV